MGPLGVLVLLDTRPSLRHWLPKDSLIEFLSTPRGLALMLLRYKHLPDNILPIIIDGY